MEVLGGFLFVFVGWSAFFAFFKTHVSKTCDVNEKDVIKIRVKNAVFEYVLSFHLLTA